MKFRFQIWIAILVATAWPVVAQSTFGAIVGDVKDAAGATMVSARVELTNTGERAQRSTMTNSQGTYQFLNLKPGNYEIKVTATGFQTTVLQELALQARQTLRVDVELTVGQLEQTVEVKESVGVIATETATVAATLGSEKVETLPANFRASRTTSPYSLITTLPGVQSDNSGNYSIQGGLPSQSQSSIDGISSQHVRDNRPLTNIFPSVESIAEIKVQGVGNQAEYGGLGDITTVSKSGTNAFHGALFWYHQNRALDAKAYGATTKPFKVANNFGYSFGGPVWIPKIYNGHNKTFFFTAYEDLRYPQGATIQNQVPTQALRNGDFTRENVTVKDPLTGQPFPGNVIPAGRISPVAKRFLDLFPLPNVGDTTVSRAANYVDNRDNTTKSRQFDIRGDHYITSTMSGFVRYSQKNQPLTSPNALLIPSTTSTQGNRSLFGAHNWAINAHLQNEFRIGFTAQDESQNFGFDGLGFAKSLGLTGLPTPLFNGLPNVSIDQFTGLGVGRQQGQNLYRTIQFNNNTTWVVGRHNIKAGVDVRWLRSKTTLGFIGADNFGNFDFGGAFTGSGFGDFLLGLPSQTSYGNVTSDNDGRSRQYAAYVQDSWKVTRKLTLELGVRWEYIPPFRDESGNIGNFDRTVAKTGRVIYPSSPQAAKLLAPGLLLSVNACPGTPNLPAPGPGLAGVPCTPFITAKEAGLDEGLRNTYPYQFYPRFGFAYRPFANDRTVVRGGFGIYNMPITGGVFYSLTGTAQTDVRTFTNLNAQGRPTFQWPATNPGGSGVTADAYGNAYFGTANAIEFIPPYAMQWHISMDRDLGFNTGLRVSYIASRSVHLPYAPNLNQLPYSTTYALLQPLQARPFPYWGRIESRDVGAIANYQSLQVEVNRRFSNGLTFQGAYTFAKNLADNAGPNDTNFPGETGGGRILDSNNRAGGYGNVSGTRRHRFISTAYYDLPVGRGRKFAPGMSRWADAVVGGWRISSILLLQTGPYLTPSFGSGVGDPSGTGSGLYRTQRPDRIGDYVPANQNRDTWVNRNAFVCPGRVPGSSTQYNCRVGLNPASDPAPIGRFGNAGFGIIQGPGTINLSMSLGKSFAITERVRFKIDGSFTNLPNHVNLADPVLNLTNSAFGRITSARGAEFGGSRTGQVSARLEF